MNLCGSLLLLVQAAFQAAHIIAAIRVVDPTRTRRHVLKCVTEPVMQGREAPGIPHAQSGSRGPMRRVRARPNRPLFRQPEQTAERPRITTTEGNREERQP